MYAKLFVAKHTFEIFEMKPIAEEEEEERLEVLKFPVSEIKIMEPFQKQPGTAVVVSYTSVANIACCGIQHIGTAFVTYKQCCELLKLHRKLLVFLQWY